MVCIGIVLFFLGCVIMAAVYGSFRPSCAYIDELAKTRPLAVGFLIWWR